MAYLVREELSLLPLVISAPEAKPFALRSSFDYH